MSVCPPIMPESWNIGARRDGRCLAMARKTRSRDNKYTHNNRRIVGRGAFQAVRAVSNTQYVVEGK
jgi:hypothetical protein